MAKITSNTLQQHLTEIKEGKRSFENAFQGVARMILESDIEKVVVNGKTTYDFSIFRDGKKHIIGMYDEINSFVSYVKDAAESGSSAEMAFVLVGEPGNGKTFFVDYLCAKYRNFLSQDKNRKYTFRFINMDKLGNYGKINTIVSGWRTLEIRSSRGCNRLCFYKHKLTLHLMVASWQECEINRHFLTSMQHPVFQVSQ